MGRLGDEGAVGEGGIAGLGGGGFLCVGGGGTETGRRVDGARSGNHEEREPGGAGHRQRRVCGRPAAQPSQRRAQGLGGSARARLRCHREDRRRLPRHAPRHDRIRAQAQGRRRRPVLLRRPRRPGGRPELPDSRRRRDRGGGARRGRGGKRRQGAGPHGRRPQPSEHRHPGCVPRQPVRALVPHRQPRSGADAGAVRHLHRLCHGAGENGRRRFRRQQPVHGGVGRFAGGSRSPD